MSDLPQAKQKQISGLVKVLSFSIRDVAFEIETTAIEYLKRTPVDETLHPHVDALKEMVEEAFAAYHEWESHILDNRSELTSNLFLMLPDFLAVLVDKITTTAFVRLSAEQLRIVFTLLKEEVKDTEEDYDEYQLHQGLGALSEVILEILAT
ncbi:hypothetical protein VTL71DRAFT_13294 [Oculimacula yallundae]|uniref:Uncharacterized protein n=1 Tax=Oculimacula yallundae TaxID=86028 RepID=A0ABR4CM11_9HELO